MKGMKLSLAIALMVGLAVGMGRAVHAAVLFEQVPSAGGTAFISSPPVLLTGDPGYRQADSFQLSQDAVVRDLHWWGNKSEKYLNAGGSYTLVDDYNFTWLCCTNQSEGAIPLTPDGFMPRARFEAFRAG